MPKRRFAQAKRRLGGGGFRPGGRGWRGPERSKAVRLFAAAMSAEAPGSRAGDAVREAGVDRRGGGGSSELSARRRPGPARSDPCQATIRPTTLFANPGGRLFGAAAAGRRGRPSRPGRTKQIDPWGHPWAARLVDLSGRHRKMTRVGSDTSSEGVGGAHRAQRMVPTAMHPGTLLLSGLIAADWGARNKVSWPAHGESQVVDSRPARTPVRDAKRRASA